MKPLGTKDWTPYEDMIRQNMLAEGLSYAQIAVVLKRSRTSIAGRIFREKRKAAVEAGERAPYHPLRDNTRLQTLLARSF